MSWLRRLVAWLIGPSLVRLERRANEYGMLTLQQLRGANGFEWMASLRPHEGPKYSWTRKADTIVGAIAGVIREAETYKIGASEVMPHAPRLGGREFDE